MRRRVQAVIAIPHGARIPTDGIARAKEAMTKLAGCEVVNVKYRHREPHASHPTIDIIVYRGTAVAA